MHLWLELGSHCFSPNSDVGLVENVAENIQEKKQFAKLRMLQIEEGKYVYHILYFPIPHNALCLPPKFCINNCYEMLLGGEHIPKSISQQ